MFDTMKLFDLQRFATENTQTTLLSGMDPEIKTTYEKRMIDLMEPNLVYNRYGDQYTIPEGGGKTLEWRTVSRLPKITTALTEGVTPDGQAGTVTTQTASPLQYGGYLVLSDLLKMTAFDPIQAKFMSALASQAARSIDTITRETLMAGTSVFYCPTVSSGTETAVTTRYGLTATAVFNIGVLMEAVANLKAKLADPVDGNSYVCIVHPHVAMDIKKTEEWKNARIYTDPSDILSGKLGNLDGVTFVESSEAKIFKGANLATVANLSVKTAITGTPAAEIAVKEAISSAQATALVGRKVLIGGTQYEVASASAAAAGSATITLTTTLLVAADTVIYPGEAGAANIPVYGCLLVGKGAYGTVKLAGGALEYIVHQLGSSGVADALNQRSSMGWKATHGAKILNEDYMTRIECGCSKFSTAAAN